MRNGLITQPELGIHYATHHLQQTSQSNTENLYFPLPRALHPLKQTNNFFIYSSIYLDAASLFARVCVCLVWGEGVAFSPAGLFMS